MFGQEPWEEFVSRFRAQTRARDVATIIQRRHDKRHTKSFGTFYSDAGIDAAQLYWPMTVEQATAVAGWGPSSVAVARFLDWKL